MNTYATSEKHQSKLAVAWVLCLLTSIFYAFQYVLRLLPNIMKDEIMLKYAIDASDFGNFNGIYYIGYSLLHLPVGLMLDRIGPKYVLSVSIFLCGLGIIPPLYCDSWWINVFGRFLLGAGSTTAILGMFYVIRLNFPPERFASILGISVTLGLAGALFGNRPLGILKEIFGWENVLHILFIVAIILSVLFLVTMPNQKENVEHQKVSIISDLRELLSNTHVWAVALLAGLMIGPLEGFTDAWGVPFFKTVYAIDEANSQILPSMIFLGFCFGAPVLGYLGQKYKRPYSIMIFSALLMGLIFSLILMFQLTNIPLLYVLMTLAGVLCAYQIFMIFINTRVVKPYLVGISSSFTNMVVMSFGAIFHSVIGWIMVKCWDGQTVDGLPVYSSHAHIYGLMIIPLALFGAFLGFILIKPKDESVLFKETAN